METAAIGIDGLVLETETLTITEAGETTGIFISSAVSRTETVILTVKTKSEYRSKVTPTEFWSLAAVATVLLILFSTFSLDAQASIST